MKKLEGSQAHVLNDGVTRVKDEEGFYELKREPDKYKANQGPNRHERRKLEAEYRKQYGSLAFKKLKEEQANNGR